MRVKFNFDNYSTLITDLLGEIWVNFPCRLNTYDIIEWSVFGEKIEGFIDIDKMPAMPMVLHVRFENDVNGIYQHVWLKL